MALTGREKWLFILTVFKTTQTGKMMPLKMQQAVSEFLRKKIAREISYDEWLQMEYDIRKIKSEVMDLMFEGMQAATSDTALPPEARKMFDEMELGDLDDKVRSEVQKIDFGMIKKALESLPKKQKKELEPMFENVEKLAGEYKGDIEQDEDKG